MKKILFSILCLILTVAGLQAQYRDLLDDPNITWVSEYTTDFQPSFDFFTEGKQVLNDATLVKFSNPGNLNNGIYPHGYDQLCAWQGEYLIADLADGMYETYEDEQMRRPLSKEALLSRITQQDTIAIFDPKTFQENVTITRSTITSDKVSALRAKFVLYYDKKTGTFGSRLLAFAPMLQSNASPALWVKAPEPTMNAHTALQSDDVTFAVQTRMKGNAPVLAKLPKIKGSLDAGNFWEEIIASPSNTFRSPAIDKPLSKEEIKTINNPTDTVITYDPETQVEKSTIVRHDNLLKEVKTIRLVHLWCYDKKRKQLTCRQTGMAPMVEVRDTGGVFRFSKPLFYVVAK